MSFLACVTAQVGHVTAVIHTKSIKNQPLTATSLAPIGAKLQSVLNTQTLLLSEVLVSHTCTYIHV